MTPNARSALRAVVRMTTLATAAAWFGLLAFIDVLVLAEPRGCG